MAEPVAEGSIRLGILKVIAGLDQVVRPAGCRGLDPIGDTESWMDVLFPGAPSSCRGLDPIGDTESVGGIDALPAELVLQRARSDWGY